MADRAATTDERRERAAAAILREAERWGHDSITPSMADLMAARALEAADRVRSVDGGESQ